MSDNVDILRDDLGQPLEYASFNRRVIAGTIDAVLACMILTPLSSILNYFFFQHQGLAGVIRNFFEEHDKNVDTGQFFDFFVGHIALKYIIVQLLLLFCIMPFFVIFWSKKNQTPGKMLTSCIILDAKSGKAPTTRHYVIRFFAYILSALPLGIGFIVASFSKHNQALHDYIANTVVVLDPKRKQILSSKFANYMQSNQRRRLTGFINFNFFKKQK